MGTARTGRYHQLGLFPPLSAEGEGRRERTWSSDTAFPRRSWSVTRREKKPRRGWRISFGDITKASQEEETTFLLPGHLAEASWGCFFSPKGLLGEKMFPPRVGTMSEHTAWYTHTVSYRA
ncbi:hypothetical protein B296_00018601 [Ensete ventricosum]|uniref:Uncharacterized protein n=1 Tax=Ensete ventricosum TaxID=4639 RepID=A0A427APZ3_ENSVE|nr:hypothetical protein B296_00018601 [Ensete ventricosum]